MLNWGYILGLVDALADPRGYLSVLDKEKQRQKQLEAYGVQQEDIAEVLPKKGAQKSVPVRATNSGGDTSLLSVTSGTGSASSASVKEDKSIYVMYT